MPYNTHIKGVYINTPCHQNWDAMTEAEKGRFCNQCSKIVYDFTNTNPEEFFNIYRENKGQVCGMFYAAPTSFWYTQKTNVARLLRQSKVAIIALGMVAVGVSYAKAQQTFGRLKVVSAHYNLRPTVANAPTQTTTDSNTFITLSFKIKDADTKELILKNFTVSIVMDAYNLTIKEINNGVAIFQIPAEMVNDSAFISVRGAGYETTRIELANLSATPDVYLKDSHKAQIERDKQWQKNHDKYKRKWWQFWKPKRNMIMGAWSF
jgi:hypothetical protein